NELVNRRSLSSSAAAARHELLEAMIAGGDYPDLGMEGYPPAVSMYRSLLRRPGIHREEQGAWGFHPPAEGSDAGLRAAWEAMERFLAETEEGPKGVDELFRRLKAPPLGMLDGPLPVLLLTLLLHHQA